MIDDVIVVVAFVLFIFAASFAVGGLMAYLEHSHPRQHGRFIDWVFKL